MKELNPLDSATILQNRKQIKKQLLQNPDLTEKKIAILSGSTVGDTKNILEIFLLQHGIRPVFLEGQYNRFFEEAVFDNGQLIEFAPDIVYIHTSNKNITAWPAIGEDEASVLRRAEDIFARFCQVWEKIKEELHCPVIQNNFEESPWRVLGNSDAYHPSGGVYFVNLLNRMFCEYAQKNGGVYINDLHYQASWYGLMRWYDNAQWYMYKYPFAVDAIPLVCHNIANIIKAIFGKNKKALALDLDNTLWGGVIGDDGVEQIKLGMDTPEGMAFMDFQKYLKALSQAGISLNICSKNEEDTAMQGFDHPSSVLRRDDFIVVKANWNNKDRNIAEIAGGLNILPESMVFVDDNAAERELVQASIPGLQVPALSRPEEYIRELDQPGFFEATSVSADDRKRNEYYKANAQRAEEQSRFADYGEYLRSLNMICRLEPFGRETLQRAVQLINKTNQFNLTTRRYTEEEVWQYAGKSGNFTICAGLVDRYGDNGIVSALMAGTSENVAQIDLWVMSCRVFKRDLELAVFDELVRQCQKAGVAKIKGTYIKTGKNGLVEDFYGTLGFTCIQKDGNGCLWEYSIPQEYKRKNQVMEVKADE